MDNFDFTTTDEVTLMELVKSASNFLHRAEYHLAKTVIDQSNSSSKDEYDNIEPCLPVTINPIGQQVEHSHDFLQNELLENLKHEIQTLTFLSTGTKKPGVCLFGDVGYVYSKETRQLATQPLKGTVVKMS